MKKILCSVLVGLGYLVPLAAAVFIARRLPMLAHILDGKGMFRFTEEETGVHYLVHCRSNIDRMLVRGDYAKELGPILSGLVPPSRSVIDCGSNVGAVALRCGARMIGDAQLVAIEPGPTLAARLRSNLALNPEIEARTLVIEAGVSDSPGTLYWNPDSSNAGNANLLHSSGLPVPITTIDAVVAETKIKDVGLLKLDVEGMELEAILGARDLITRDRPVIYYEASLGYERKRGRQYVLEIEQFLNSLGYRVGFWGNGFVESKYPSIRQNMIGLPATRRIESRIS